MSNSGETRFVGAVKGLTLVEARGNRGGGGGIRRLEEFTFNAGELGREDRIALRLRHRMLDAGPDS